MVGSPAKETVNRDGVDGTGTQESGIKEIKVETKELLDYSSKRTIQSPSTGIKIKGSLNFQNDGVTSLVGQISPTVGGGLNSSNIKVT